MFLLTKRSFLISFKTFSFKYILCSYLSRASIKYMAEKTEFKYISCSYLSEKEDGAKQSA